MPRPCQCRNWVGTTSDGTNVTRCVICQQRVLANPSWLRMPLAQLFASAISTTFLGVWMFGLGQARHSEVTLTIVVDFAVMGIMTGMVPPSHEPVYNNPRRVKSSHLSSRPSAVTKVDSIIGAVLSFEPTVNPLGGLEQHRTREHRPRQSV